MGNIVNQDTLRKYFKDTNASELTGWYNNNVAKFFSKKGAILKEGIFLLDGSIIALPDNNNYQMAEYLPLDGHKNYVDIDKLPGEEAKKFKYTLCYKMVNLLHISKEKDYFVFLATRITGGKSHDKLVGEGW